mgnify:CR=1 FL=1
MRLAAGDVVRKQEITEYNRIQETLARRTFDESGDYTLQPFTLGFREHLNNLSNNGVFTSTSSPRGDESKFVAVVSAGKSYVRGFEVDKQTPTFLTFDKARTTSSKDNMLKDVQDFEPDIALFAKENGLRCFKMVLDNLIKYENKKQLIIFEIGYNQLQPIQKLLKNTGFQLISVEKDVSDIPRCIVTKRI